MKNQIELIGYYTEQLMKVIVNHGVGSGHFYRASFKLKGAQMGLSVPNLIHWADVQMDALHKDTLNFVGWSLDPENHLNFKENGDIVDLKDLKLKLNNYDSGCMTNNRL